MKKQYNCEKCQMLSSTGGKFRRHVKLVHNEVIPLPCDLCNETFLNKKLLTLHTRSFHKTITCSICKLNFVSKYVLRNHIDVVHEKIKPFKCDSCNQTFALSGNLSAHKMSVHEKIKNLKCGHCDARFSFKIL